ncbi:MAG: hypothetical protein ACFFDN_52270 [Candidatus Hodarchaeota archaeon]
MIIITQDEKSEKEEEQEVPSRGKDWERTFTIEESRLNEYIELYESIGYEVRVEPASPDEIQECQVCFKAEFDNLRTIYIKRTRNNDNEMDLEELI